MKSSRYIIIHKHRGAAGRGSRFLSFLKGFGLTLLALILTGLTGLGLAYAIFTQGLPSLDLFRLTYEAKPGPTTFYARDGETSLFTLAYADFAPQELKLCADDGEGCFPRKFLEADRLTRKEGKSIAEEMVRKVYADFIRESRHPDFAARALSEQIRRTYGDEQITEWYYNTAWFGQMAFGLDAASRLYLDKPGSALNDAECVLMSAVINAPMLNPIDSKGALRDFYLNQLAALGRAGLFSEDETNELAHSNFIIFEPPRYINGMEPDIITRKALDAVMHLYGREQVERGGLKVVTTEDAALQAYLNCVTSVENEAENSACPLSSAYTDDERRAAAEALRTAPASIAVLDTESGEVLSELEAQLNNENRRVYNTSLQTYPIGSAMNYFAAVTAFSGGSAPSTLLWDLEDAYDLSREGEEARTESFHGPVQLREALNSDYLRPLSAHLQRFGSGAVQRTAALFGLSNSHMLTDSEALTEGGSYTAESLAYALIPFATQGEQTGSDSGGAMHPVSILYIEHEDGTVDDPQPETRKSLIAENLAYLVHNVFSQDSSGLRLSDRPAAVKISAVNGESSRWVSGYTKDLSCAIRLADPKTISAFVVDTDQVQATSEILWRSVMEFAQQDTPVSGWDVPAGISQVRICLPSGKLPTSVCRETMTDVFLRGNEPYEFDEFYVEVPINRENRMLATRYTPPEDVVNEIFLSLPANAAEWAAANGIEQVPTAYDPIRSTAQSGAVRIESPTAFQTFGHEEKIDIIVRLALNRRAESVQVSLGSGMFPSEWQEVCSGSALDNGQWKLCTLDGADLEPGLYCLRTAFMLPEQGYQAGESYFIMKNEQ
ncbi:MAG: transglycosylase domain-containing protein [Flexilinea sp.]|nr:transglycosylase domain-containing protein [Flexilinea sp.]